MEQVCNFEGAARNPLVSIVVCNFNYGKFLPKAISSILSQTYLSIETIIIDDCSTDNSPAILADLKRDNPDIIIHSNAKNVGQGASSRAGFEISTGAYVVFLDADDYLMPTCVEAHVRTHLSMRIPVGMTSVDMVQIIDDRIVTKTSSGFGDYVLSGRGAQFTLHRSIGASAGIAMEDADPPLHFVHPKEARHWPWSPTSGNCFRRDALDLIMRSDRLLKVERCADTYFVRGVAALAGSVLIDRPLAVYRLHGSNDFAKTASLYRMRGFDPTYLRKHSGIAMVALIEHIFENFEMLARRMESPLYLMETLDALDDCWPPIADEREFGFLARKLATNQTMLISVLGRQAYYDWMASHLLSKHWRRSWKGFGPAIGRLLAAFPIMMLARFISRRHALPSSSDHQLAGTPSVPHCSALVVSSTDASG